MSRGCPGTRRPVARVAAPLLAAPLFAALLFAQPVAWPPAAQANELDDAVDVRSEGNRSSARSQVKIDGLSEQTESLLGEYRIALQQIESLRVYNRQLEQLTESQDSEMTVLRGEIDNVTVIGRQVTPLMLGMIDTLDSFVELDLPFLPSERSSRVESLREMMARADVADSEKFRRLLEAYQVENEYGRTIEAYTGDLEVDGKKRTVEFLRVGRLALVYQTLDGRETGHWDANAGAWAPLDDEYRLSINKGLRMARKQAAPDLILLPVRAPERAPEAIQ